MKRFFQKRFIYLILLVEFIILAFVSSLNSVNFHFLNQAEDMIKKQTTFDPRRLAKVDFINPEDTKKILAKAKDEGIIKEIFYNHVLNVRDKDNFKLIIGTDYPTFSRVNVVVSDGESLKEDDFSGPGKNYVLLGESFRSKYKIGDTFQITGIRDKKLADKPFIVKGFMRPDSVYPMGDMTSILSTTNLVMYPYNYHQTLNGPSFVEFPKSSAEGEWQVKKFAYEHYNIVPSVVRTQYVLERNRKVVQDKIRIVMLALVATTFLTLTSLIALIRAQLKEKLRLIALEKSFGFTNLQIFWQFLKHIVISALTGLFIGLVTVAYLFKAELAKTLTMTTYWTNKYLWISNGVIFASLLTISALMIWRRLKHIKIDNLLKGIYD